MSIIVADPSDIRAVDREQYFQFELNAVDCDKQVITR
jgi:hypothetical protein